MFKRILLSLFLCTGFICSLYAQEEADRSIGLSAAIQNTQFDILVPIWISSRTVLAPAVSAVFLSDVGTDLGVGLSPRFYMREPEGLTPYLGLRLGGIFSFSRIIDNTIDVISGIALGGEYFFSSHFSMGVEAQLNAVFSDENSSRFGNPGGTNINTGGVILANIYF